MSGDRVAAVGDGQVLVAPKAPASWPEAPGCIASTGRARGPNRWRSLHL